MSKNNEAQCVLAQRLREASAAYYGGGKPSMSDAEFDALEAELRKRVPKHPALAEVGAPPSSGWPKVTHPITMGSLAKVQNNAELDSWVHAINWAAFRADPLTRNEGWCVTEKMDGISVLLTYTDGVLVRAATRGDGTTGEDITRNVRVMKGVPATLPTLANCKRRGDVHVRGEIICKKSDFLREFSAHGYSNPRNTASGVSKRFTGWQKCRHLTVYAYNLFGASLTSRASEMIALTKWGFNVPSVHGTAFERNGGITSTDRIQAFHDLYTSGKRESRDYEIDGLVVEVNDTVSREALGTTPDGLRPKGAVAYKFPHEAQQTTLRNIRWQVGTTGRVTPVAEFDAVDLAGASVKQASLHNLANINKLTDGAGFMENATILVSRRNDVIPYVEALVSQHPLGVECEAPQECPECGFGLKMDGEYLVCDDGGDGPGDLGCPAQILGGIRRWVKKIGVLHFGDRLIEAVVEAGMVKTIPDLYRLDEQAMAGLSLNGRRVGGAAKRALGSLHAHKTLPLDTFVGSLGIPLCGRRMVGMLMDAGICDLNMLSQATEAQLALAPGFGVDKARAFRVGFDGCKETIIGLYAVGVTVAPHEPKTATSGVLSGVSVCMTGFRDKPMENAIDAAGGTVKSSVSKALGLLVAKDPNSQSGKAQKARTYGIEVIGPDEMWSRLGGQAQP